MSEITPEQMAKVRAEVEAKVRAELGGSQMIQTVAPHPTGTAAHDAEHNPKTIKVIVMVAARGIPGAGAGEAYPGVGCAHLFWPNGSTERMVTDRQYAELLACPSIQVTNLTEMEARERAKIEATLAAQVAATKSESEAKADAVANPPKAQFRK